ncbi:MAG: TonB-dependent receptor [Bryobacteraceae bacterium]
MSNRGCFERYIRLLLLSLFASICFGQFSSSVQGVVHDPSGGAVANAAVTLINNATQVKQDTTTDNSGNYWFVSLAPGSYTISATAPGFVKTDVPVTLQTSQNLNVPVGLTLASTSTAVEVTGAPPVIDTADSRNQQTIQTQELAALPLPGRNMINLVTLAPGVTGKGVAGFGSPGSAVDNFSTETQVDASANGRSSNGNMFIVDGLDVTSNIRPGVLNLVPNPDSVQEASIQVNTFTVDYGRASSIQMTMTTKSGSDQFHGLASDYFTYQNFWAGTEFVHNYAPFHSNNISANIGGPIVPHHQFFFFFGIEPLRSLTSTGNNVITFESPQFTNFAASAFPGTVGTKLLTTYPASGATITGVSQTAAQLFPTTCGTAATAFLPCGLPVIDNGIFNASDYRNALEWNARIDKYYTNDRIYGNFFRTTLSTGGPSVRPAFATTSQYTTNSLQVNETHTFTPTTLNEAAFAFLRVEGISPATGNFEVPVVSVTGLGTGFGDGFASGDFIQHSYHWRDVLTRIQGNHTLKFGYDGWHGDDVALFAGARGQGNFQFNNILDLVEDQPFSESGLSYNPLTGQPQAGNYGYAMTTGGIFAQDTWKIRPNLTLNYGIRWDDFGNPYPSLKGTNLSNFFLGSGSSFDQQVASGVMKKVNNVFTGPIDNVWSPRFGVAWDPANNGNWVLRGGFGMYHDFPTLGNDENGLNANPPGYIIPTFYSNATTAPPIFAFGTSNKYPFGFPYPALASTTLTPQGGLTGVQLSVGGIDPSLIAPTTFNYAATLEHKLVGSLVGSVGYSGSKSYNLITGYGQVTNTSYGIDINRYAGDLIQHNSTSPTRLNPSFGAINYAENNAEARYDALIVDVRGRFARRGYFDASYTRSRSLDDTEVYPTFQNLSQYYGPSPWNAPNRFSFSWNYDLPGINSGHGLFGHVLGGWSISGTAILQSGNPFTVFTNAPFEPIFGSTGTIVGLQPGSGDYNADGFNYDYPNSANYSMGTSRQAYLQGVFSPGQFTQPTLGQEGNEKVNQFQNPGFNEWDAALLKNTQLYERLNFQLRFEVYNVFNRVNLQGVDSNLPDGNFGRVTSQYNPRNLQVGAKLTF